MVRSRVLVKLSGEALGGTGGSGIDADSLRHVRSELAELVRSDIQVAVVVGAGNFFRGRLVGSSVDGELLPRVTADHMGMLGTVMNALAVQSALGSCGIPASILTPAPLPGVGGGFSAERGRAMLENGRVVICGGGTGTPLFSTDTAACLRAIELEADLVIKGTLTDGVYEADPRTHPHARKFDRLTFDEVLQRELKIIDHTAAVLCRDHGMPMCVYDIRESGALLRIARGGLVGTLMTADTASGRR